jgi:hypothetical protein
MKICKVGIYNRLEILFHLFQCGEITLSNYMKLLPKFKYPQYEN